MPLILINRSLFESASLVVRWGESGSFSGRCRARSVRTHLPSLATETRGVGEFVVSILSAIRRFCSRASEGEESFWRVWWLAGIPVGWTTAALVIAAEQLRYAGNSGLGDLLDVARFLIYLVWFQLAWRCSRNVVYAPWTPLARGILAVGLVLSVMF